VAENKNYERDKSMKITKFVILFCLICSSVFLAFALYVEKGWLKSQKNVLAVSSTATDLNEVRQRFVSLDEKTKLKFFDDFLSQLGNRDVSISNSINSSFEMTQTAVNAVLGFNFLAAFCVVYLFVKARQGSERKAIEKPFGVIS
jgi:hypothetical protein